MEVGRRRWVVRGNKNCGVRIAPGKMNSRSEPASFPSTKLYFFFRAFFSSAGAGPDAPHRHRSLSPKSRRTSASFLPLLNPLHLLFTSRPDDRWGNHSEARS